MCLTDAWMWLTKTGPKISISRQQLLTGLKDIVDKSRDRQLGGHDIILILFSVFSKLGIDGANILSAFRIAV